MTFRSLTLAIAILLLTAAGAEAAGQSRQAMVLVDDAGGSAAASASAHSVASANSLRRVRADVPEVGLMTVAIPRNESFQSFARRLKRDRRVVSVARQRHRRPLYVPNDPGFNKIDRLGAPGATYQWYLEREHLPAAWDLSRGDGVKVGIIDTGADTGNPDLGPNVDVVVDHDATTEGPGDEVGHGTHVAGLACGAGDNGVGIVGTGFNCRVVMEKTDLTSSSIISSIVDAANRGVKVMNMSFGGRGETPGEARALRFALDRDVVLVAAAADSPEVNQGHPASDIQPMGTGPKIKRGTGLVVTAAGNDDQRAFFAGRGSQISLAAYGYTGEGGAPGIFSTFPANQTQFETGNTKPPSRPCDDCRGSINGDTRYGYLFGTSMAAPQVAGIVALVRAANPKLSYLSVIRLIKDTASLGSWNSEIGWGIVDAGAAVAMAKSYAPDTVAPTSKPSGTRKRSSGRVFKLKWSSKDGAPAGVRASGVESYRVFAKRGGKYKLVDTTTETTESFKGTRGTKYSFYIQARDLAGNLEAPPAGADFVVRVRR